MSVSLRQLEIFVAVVQTGSISRATRRVGLSQPTVSQQIAKLEEELGTQLMLRTRSASVELTPAGEFWYHHGARMVTEMKVVRAEHDLNYSGNALSLRFGTTPSLRGRFLGAAARIATESGDFSRFDFLWGLNSKDVLEQVNLHHLNCAVVSESSVVADRASLHVTPLFDDTIVWVVPESVPHAAVAEALATRRIGPGQEALARYVDVGDAVPWHAYSANWYRRHLPFSMPYFGALTHEAAVEFVAAGLATCHGPLSLFPNLPDAITRKVRLYKVDGVQRRAVLVMPKHLLSIRPFAEFRRMLAEYASTEYCDQMNCGIVRPAPLLKEHAA